MAEITSTTKEDNFGYDWIANLLSLLDNNQPATSNAGMFKNCSATHYRIANMDKITAEYQGNLDRFIQFLVQEWHWRITYDLGTQTITADEAKNFCVCPIAQKNIKLVSGMLCHCSEDFAEQMFSAVLGKPVKAAVIRSILRGAESCVYSIKIL